MYDPELATKGVINSIMAIGHIGNKNIVIDPVHAESMDDIIDEIEARLNIKTRGWVVKYGDGFTIDTWDKMLIKKY